MKTSTKDPPKYQTRLTSKSVSKKDDADDVASTALIDVLPDSQSGDKANPTKKGSKQLKKTKKTKDIKKNTKKNIPNTSSKAKTNYATAKNGPTITISRKSGINLRKTDTHPANDPFAPAPVDMSSPTGTSVISVRTTFPPTTGHQTDIPTTDTSIPTDTVAPSTGAVAPSTDFSFTTKSSDTFVQANSSDPTNSFVPADSFSPTVTLVPFSDPTTAFSTQKKKSAVTQ